MSTTTIAAPKVPARPSWATATDEPVDEYNGTWLLEFSAPIGTFGLELAEMCRYTPAAGWTVYAELVALMPQIEIDTAEELRAYAAEVEQCAAIMAQHTRPVGAGA
ncbi:hypothetical protein [Oerskovia paurometabola]|uniref:hypothetical protein n=1 Tax=Oerskovia paurometabola TaxID=162170 RepID=UPI00382136F0